MLCVFTNFEPLSSSTLNKASRLTSDWKPVKGDTAYLLIRNKDETPHQLRRRSQMVSVVTNVSLKFC